MAMTDKQFKGFLSFVIGALREAQTEADPERQQARLERIVSNLQRMIKD